MLWSKTSWVGNEAQIMMIIISYDVRVMSKNCPDDMLLENIWCIWLKSSKNWEKLRCHACDILTYTHVKVGQYSWAQSAKWSLFWTPCLWYIFNLKESHFRDETGKGTFANVVFLEKKSRKTVNCESNQGEFKLWHWNKRQGVALRRRDCSKIEMCNEILQNQGKASRWRNNVVKQRH